MNNDLTQLLSLYLPPSPPRQGVMEPYFMTTINYKQIGNPAWRITCEAGTDLNKLQKARSIYG